MPRHLPPKRNRLLARAMRRDMPDAEFRLWRELCAHRLDGLGFRRQAPIGPFIEDFLCPAAKLVVEVDGGQHGLEPARARDAARTRRLEEHGYRVLRFWTDEVMRDIDGVCTTILAAARERLPRSAEPPV
ncbi:endonuclease domain-containing protein [Faunimonas sp. B44]|uniref:endonuclease domain-containing protein n=1 Tax=Faunimonas sp. B44 TaxID=3461493 RepID=UPI0040443FA5